MNSVGGIPVNHRWSMELSCWAVGQVRLLEGYGELSVESREALTLDYYVFCKWLDKKKIEKCESEQPTRMVGT